MSLGAAVVGISYLHHSSHAPLDKWLQPRPFKCNKPRNNSRWTATVGQTAATSALSIAAHHTITYLVDGAV
jgi:hypothetical protein